LENKGETKKRREERGEVDGVNKVERTSRRTQEAIPHTYFSLLCKWICNTPPTRPFKHLSATATCACALHEQSGVNPRNARTHDSPIACESVRRLALARPFSAMRTLALELQESAREMGVYDNAARSNLSLSTRRRRIYQQHETTLKPFSFTQKNKLENNLKMERH
jgi:hypothetical protein